MKAEDDPYAAPSPQRCTRALHHVIIRGIERRPISEDDSDREDFKVEHDQDLIEVVRKMLSLLKTRISQR